MKTESTKFVTQFFFHLLINFHNLNECGVDPFPAIIFSTLYYLLNAIVTFTNFHKTLSSCWRGSLKNGQVLESHRISALRYGANGQGCLAHNVSDQLGAMLWKENRLKILCWRQVVGCSFVLCQVWREWSR